MAAVTVRKAAANRYMVIIEVNFLLKFRIIAIIAVIIMKKGIINILISPT